MHGWKASRLVMTNVMDIDLPVHTRLNQGLHAVITNDVIGLWQATAGKATSSLLPCVGG